MEAIKIRPLGIVEQALSELGIKPTYAYDDLLFVETNTFLIRFDDNNSHHVFVHFNVDCNKKKEIQHLVKPKFKSVGIEVSFDSDFTINEKPDVEEFELEFLR